MELRDNFMDVNDIYDLSLYLKAKYGKEFKVVLTKGKNYLFTADEKCNDNGVY